MISSRRPRRGASGEGAIKRVEMLGKGGHGEATREVIMSFISKKCSDMAWPSERSVGWQSVRDRTVV
jgi:hypothetical protein